MDSQEYFKLPQRWIGEGLEAIGSGIAWAGMWIALAMVLIKLIERLPK